MARRKKKRPATGDGPKPALEPGDHETIVSARQWLRKKASKAATLGDPICAALDSLELDVANQGLFLGTDFDDDDLDDIDFPGPF